MKTKIKAKLIDLSKKNKFLRKIMRNLSFVYKRINYLFGYYYRYSVNEKTIIFESFNGSSCACSPKAIYLQMLKDERFNDYNFVWSFVKPDDKLEYFKDSRTILVKRNSKEYKKYYAMSKYWITNSLVDVSIKKKKNQVYVQTWHGTPLKRLRCDIEVNGAVLNTVSEIKKRNDKDAIRFDYFLSPSKYATECFKSAFNLKALGKEDIIIEEGYPRNDFLFNFTEKDVSKIKKNLKIKGDKKIILYAPTFRDNQHKSGQGYTYSLGLDFDKLYEQLSDEYIILFRTHYFISNTFDFKKYKGFIYDVSNYDDVNDLYVISDILLTDYSSVFFDFANLKRPMLFYMYDLNDYKNNLRDFYIDLEELPGPIIEKEEELVSTLKKLKINKRKYQQFNKKFNYLDGPNCSLKVIDKIFDDDKKNKKSNKSPLIEVFLILLLVLLSFLTYDWLLKKELKESNFNIIEEYTNVFTKNSIFRLNIKSVYGDIEAYHPKVLYFKNKWNGYKYWMVYTPYPKGDDRKENPHVVVSNDLINWETIQGSENPLDTPDEAKLFKKYNSDGTLVYNNDTNTLECYWRYVDDVSNVVYVYKRTTKDGINWTAKEVFLYSSDRTKNDYVSPDILYENGTYKIWYIDKYHTLKYRETIDGTTFTEPEIINISYPSTLKVWHIDVSKTEKGYEMIFVGYPDRKVYHYMNLYYTVSSDEKHFKEAIKILTPSENPNAWDGQGLYKSTMLYIDGIYYVLYSAHNDTVKGTGIVFGSDITNLKGTDIDYIKDKDAAEKFSKMVERSRQDAKN